MYSQLKPEVARTLFKEATEPEVMRTLFKESTVTIQTFCCCKVNRCCPITRPAHDIAHGGSHQPVSDVQPTGLSGSMERCHAISGGDLGVSFGIFHKVVHSIKVPILCCKVN